MNSRQLQYALALAQTRNFSQVAEKLNISQPALSKQILNLETELGIKLFDRNHVPLTLTPAGEYFMEKAAQLLYDESQMLKALDRFKSGESGQLDIGVTPFRSAYLMPDLVKRIKEKYPGVRVVLHEAPSAQLRTEAAEGKFDLAIVNLPVDDSVLDVKLLEPDSLVLAVPPSLLDHIPPTHDNTVSLSDCKELPYVVVGQNQEMRQLLEKLCARADFQPKIAAEVVGITTAWAMACAGVGATLLPMQFLRGKFFEKDLTLFRIADNLYTRQPAIVTKRGQYISEYAQYAIDLMSETTR